MIDIIKGSTPRLLKPYQSRRDIHWDDCPNLGGNAASSMKVELREALWQEQHGLCAYCMARLQHPTANKFKHVRIEHVYPRSRCKVGTPNQHLQFDYNNLVLCCRSKGFCEDVKGEKILPFSPVKTAKGRGIAHLISYQREGKIELASTEHPLALDEILNLNHPLLQMERAKIYQALIKKYQQLERKYKGDKKKIIATLLEQHSCTGTNVWTAYAGVVQFYLNKRYAGAAKSQS